MDVKALVASRAVRWGLAALALLALAWLASSWPRWQMRAQVATGFGARIACGCRYIEGRGLPSCAGDFKGLEGMGLVHFSDDPATRTIWASIPLLAKRKATYKSGNGCIPDKVG